MALEALLPMEDSATQVNISKQCLNSISKAGDTHPFNLHPKNRFEGFHLIFLQGSICPDFFKGGPLIFFLIYKSGGTLKISAQNNFTEYRLNGRLSKYRGRQAKQAGYR
jgi:hypothetical protein